MQRGWSSFADTRQKTHPTSSIRTRVFSSFSRQCVGGDVHPVGVRRHLIGLQFFSGESRFCGRWGNVAGGGAAVGGNREERISTRRIGVDFGMEPIGDGDKKVFGWDSSGHKDVASGKRKHHAPPQHACKVAVLRFLNSQTLTKSYGNISKQRRPTIRAL